MATKRGRKTAGQLEAVESIPTRPEPPADLNEREREIWIEVTNGLPVDWFPNCTLALLKAYCSHMDRFERISYQIDQKLERMQPVELQRMSKTAEVESRAAMSLATKMRITQQATLDPDRKKDKPKKSAWANVADQR